MYTDVHEAQEAMDDDRGPPPPRGHREGGGDDEGVAAAWLDRGWQRGKACHW